MSRISPAQVLADVAGVTLPEVAKRSGVSVATIRRYAASGNANSYRAMRLAHILGCDPGIFLWGASAHFSGVDGRQGIRLERNGQQPATLRHDDADTTKTRGASRRGSRTHLSLCP